MLKSFIQGSTEFSSYDDFSRNFKLSIPENFNFVSDVVDVYAKECPSKRALVWCDDEHNEKEFTFEQLSQQSNLVAKGLVEQGIKKGDVVMLVLHRRYEYWIFVLALNRIGAIALPVPFQMLKNDFEYRISASKTVMIVAASTSYIEHIEDAVSKISAGKKISLVSVNFTRQGWTSYDDLKKLGESTSDASALLCNCGGKDKMIMYFTSGTTGEPKLVEHDCLYPLSHIITAKYWQCVEPDGLHYSVAETGWAKTSWGKIYGQWIAGSAVFIYDRQGFNPNSMLEKIQKYKVTTFCAPPTIYSYLIQSDFEKYELSSLKHCCSAGDTLNPGVMQVFYEKTGLEIYEGYGQTETSLLAANFCFSKPVPGSIGKFSPCYNLKIINEQGSVCKPGETGEIVIEYSDPSNSNTENAASLHHTEDLAYMTEDGIVYFTGRKDNIIKSAGFRISPLEVEKILMQHPSVAECAVMGEEDEKRGKIVKALVVTAAGYTPSKALESELMEFMRNHTALYKCPRKIAFVKKLPKTYNGKIKRYTDKEESV